MADTPEQSFAGYTSPNYTQVPDILFDEQLPDLSGAELKVLLYIMRRTFGFKKEADNISLNQIATGIITREGTVLDRGTGLSKSTVQVALRGLTKKRIVLATKRASAERGNEATTYQLNAGATPYTENRHRAIPKIGTGLYRKSAPQDTDVQETENDLSNYRNDLHKDQIISDKTSANVTADPRGIGNNPGLTPIGAAITKRRQSQPIQTNEQSDATVEQGRGGSAARADQSPRSGGAASGRNHARRMQQDETYQVIQAYVADFARELNDRAPLKTSTTRAYHLYQRSGLDRDGFIAQLYAARAIVKERAGSIRSVGEKDAWGVPVKQRAAYFYAVLEDLLGLRDDAPEGSQQGAGSSRTECRRLTQKDPATASRPV
jgi:Bacteriophage replication protein O